MSCTDPRHADCPSCDGEILVGRTDPIIVGHVDRTTGAREEQRVELPKHVNPLCCPRPLVTFQELVARAKAGDAVALRNLRGHRAQDVQAALGSSFQVKGTPGAQDRIDLIQPTTV